jgi:hypothetical protein
MTWRLPRLCAGSARRGPPDKAATHTMAPRVSLGLEDGAEFAEVRAVGVPDGGGQQEAASRGIRLALLLDGAISLAGSPC